MVESTALEMRRAGNRTVGCESHPLRHTVNQLGELDFLAEIFGRNPHFSPQFETSESPDPRPKSQLNRSFSLRADFEVWSASEREAHS